jgi:hypothetical protein
MTITARPGMTGAEALHPMISATRSSGVLRPARGIRRGAARRAGHAGSVTVTVVPSELAVNRVNGRSAGPLITVPSRAS